VEAWSSNELFIGKNKKAQPKKIVKISTRPPNLFMSSIDSKSFNKNYTKQPISTLFKKLKPQDSLC